MMKATKQKPTVKSQYKFRPRLIPTIICAVLLLILILLGLWQLHRYQYKKVLLQTFQQRIHQPAVVLDQQLPLKAIQFQHVKLSGHFVNEKNILLTNRFRQGQGGYEVLTPFALRGAQQFTLVNRGWVKQLDPHAIQKIASVEGQQILTGYVVIPSKKGFILGKAILNPGQWPLKIQKIDLPQLSKMTNLPLSAFIVHLDANQPYGFIRNWRPIQVKPQRHLGYAIQWFAMALALFIAYIIFSRRRHQRGEVGDD